MKYLAILLLAAYAIALSLSDIAKTKKLNEKAVLVDSIFWMTDSIVMGSNPEASLDDPDSVQCEYLDLRCRYDVLR